MFSLALDISPSLFFKSLAATESRIGTPVDAPVTVESRLMCLLFEVS